MKTQNLKKVVFATMLLTLCVMGLGSYTRLIDAGLGCPDWPQCYGHWIVPHADVLSNQSAAVVAKFVPHKAWAEMTHRYFAALLVVLLAVIIWQCLCHASDPITQDFRRRYLRRPAIALLILWLYQPLLGRWTVTWKLWPVVVSQHLLCALLILALLTWIFACLSENWQEWPPLIRSKKWWTLLMLGFILLFLQMALGAWTSTNYAALSCDSFPGCMLGHAWPDWDFVRAFNVFMPIGPNYEGGLLQNAALQTIQMLHRLGALVVVTYWLWLVVQLLNAYALKMAIQRLNVILLGLLLLQVCLGISNVLWHLPLATAILHTVTAGLICVCGVMLMAKVRTDG